jgi:hypothetical protein
MAKHGNVSTFLRISKIECLGCISRCDIAVPGRPGQQGPSKTLSKINRDFFRSETTQAIIMKKQNIDKAVKKSPLLNGWKKIANFLGQPVSVAERWAKSGMPVTRAGRRVIADPDALNRWLGRESAGEPVQIAAETSDLSSELKRGLSYIREHPRPKRSPTKAVLKSGIKPTRYGEFSGRKSKV